MTEESSNSKPVNPLQAALAKAKQSGARKPAQESTNKEIKSTLFSDLAKEEQQKQQEKLDPAAALAKFTFEEQPEEFENPEQLRAALKSKLAILESSFKEDLDTVHNNLIQTEQFIREHKELRDILMPDDIAVMVNACRISYGKTIEKRNANKKQKSAKKQQEQELLGLLDMGGLI